MDYLNGLPLDILYSALDYLSIIDLVSLRRTCKALRDGILDKYGEKLRPIMGEDYLGVVLEHAAKLDDMPLIEYCFSKDYYYLMRGLKGAIQGAHIHLIDFFTEMGAERDNSVMEFAITCGNKRVVEYILESMLESEYLDDMNSDDLDRLISKAAADDQLDIMVYLISKSDLFDGYTKADAMREALWSAAHKNRKRIVEYVIEQGMPSINSGAWNMALHYAAGNGHIDLLKFCIEKGSTNLDLAMESAIRQNQIEIVHLLLTVKDEWWWANLLRLAVRYGPTELADLFAERCDALSKKKKEKRTTQRTKEKKSKKKQKM